MAVTPLRRVRVRRWCTARVLGTRQRVVVAPDTYDLVRVGPFRAVIFDECGVGCDVAVPRRVLR